MYIYLQYIHSQYSEKYIGGNCQHFYFVSLVSLNTNSQSFHLLFSNTVSSRARKVLHTNGSQNIPDSAIERTSNEAEWVVAVCDNSERFAKSYL